MNYLTWATKSKNAQNKKKSGIKGVCFHKRSKKLRAKITVHGVDVQLGSFDTIEVARYIRVKKVNEVFGVFTLSCKKI